MLKFCYWRSKQAAGVWSAMLEYFAAISWKAVQADQCYRTGRLRVCFVLVICHDIIRKIKRRALSIWYYLAMKKSLM